MVMRDEFRGFHLFQLMRYALVRQFMAKKKRQEKVIIKLHEKLAVFQLISFIILIKIKNILN